MREKCKHIFLAGHSMGGILSLILGCKHKIDGIITIGAPVGINQFGAKLAPFFSIFLKYRAIDWKELKRESNGKWVGYQKIPLNIVKKINRLIKEMKNSLSEIKCPVLLMQGRKDAVIKKYSMDFLLQNLNTKTKKAIWLENNDHPILLSPDHDIIVSEIVKFIKTVIS